MWVEGVAFPSYPEETQAQPLGSTGLSIQCHATVSLETAKRRQPQLISDGL